MQRAKEPGLRAVGVPQAHYALLMHVHAFPGYSGAEIGRGLGVTTQAAALLPPPSWKPQGLLERRTHPRHRNVKELHITAAGLDALPAARRSSPGWNNACADALGTEHSEQVRLLLETVIQHLGATTPQRES